MMDSTSPIGILLTNLGTPDAPTRKAVRKYLKEFLWDPRVVDLPRPLWWLVLNGIVLTTRPRKSAALYRMIWTEEGSPLLSISKKQHALIEAALHAQLPRHNIHIELAMRYGSPSIASGLRALRERGCRRVLLLPLYPQYSAAGTASTFDAVAAELKSWRSIPELRTINEYHDNPAYIAALAASIRDFWQAHGQPEKLLISLHGYPKRYCDQGDPYYEQCKATAALLARALDLTSERWQLTFQSKFGREEWLTPATNTTLIALAQGGTRHVDVVCPGFSADCLETLQENAMENRKIFIDAGGHDLRYIPALNDRADHIKCLTAIILKNLHEWV